jgi:hypothetical protein
MSAPTRGLASRSLEPSPGSEERGRAVAWAADVLRDHRMPSHEIEVVLTSADPIIVRRHLELHRERLQEWVDDQRRTLAAIEGLLADAAGRRRER